MHKVMVGVKCPKCQQAFFLPDVKSVSEVDNCSLSCSHENCRELILVRKGIAYSFHQYLHEQDPRWPANGSGTGHVTLE